MKVAVVGPTYPHRGGIAHYTSLLASHLAGQHDTRLYGFERQYPNWIFPGRSQLDPSERPLVPIEARRWLIPYWPLSWRRVTRDWSMWQPDRIVMQWWVPFMAPMTAWLLARARRLGLHSTLICHNVLPHERNRVDTFLGRMALTRANRLIVHTMAERDRARALLPHASIEVSPLPSYARFQSSVWTRESARTKLNLDGNVLLFFGLVRPYKGLIDLIDALPQVVNEMSIKLLIVGEIWGEAQPYRARVTELNLQSHVEFVDRYVSNDEAAMYFAAADLAVLPYREATGSAVLQLALGLGVPVVATRTGGMDEVVEHGVTGFLVAPGDVAGLSEAIKRYFREDRTRAFRAAIECSRDRFGWARLCDTLLAATDRP